MKKSPQNTFHISQPLLWLTITCLAVYLPTLFFGYTDLDDTIFIKNFEDYNQDLSNIFTAFTRGLFNATKDTYYRPLFSVSIILNYQLSGTGIMSYHFINVLLHLGCVILLYMLFEKLTPGSFMAFVLAMIFAVHPVLSQAVAWVPGRNDSMLALFLLGWLISVINFSQTQNWKWLAVQFLLLVLAFFTKETAAFAPPVAFVILIVLFKMKVFERSNILLYSSWMLAFGIYLIAYFSASQNKERISVENMAEGFVSRFPVLVQYLGKIFLPFNLSVFPIVQDTTIIYGIVAIVLLIAGLYFSKSRNIRLIITGAFIYLFFLIPSLIVPNELNSQVFEHRLYLPIIGVLLVLSQTILFQNSFGEKNTLLFFLPILIAFAVINYAHQQHFKSPLDFWTAAVKASPHAPYANMMLAIRLDKNDKSKADSLLMTSYTLDPNARFINYYIGKMKEQRGEGGEEAFYQREAEISGFASAYYELARIAFERRDSMSAIANLELYLNKTPLDHPANGSLLLLYIETGQKEKAREQLKKMQQRKLAVPKEVMDRMK